MMLKNNVIIIMSAKVKQLLTIKPHQFMSHEFHLNDIVIQANEIDKKKQKASGETLHRLIETREERRGNL